MRDLEFDAKAVLQILIDRSASDRILAALIESAIWQSKYLATLDTVDDSLTEN